jgi:hypothetical protein
MSETIVSVSQINPEWWKWSACDGDHGTAPSYREALADCVAALVRRGYDETAIRMLGTTGYVAQKAESAER